VLGLIFVLVVWYGFLGCVCCRQSSWVLVWGIKNPPTVGGRRRVRRTGIKTTSKIARVKLIARRFRYIKFSGENRGSQVGRYCSGYFTNNTKQL
jgi:hypothetical protein